MLFPLLGLPAPQKKHTHTLLPPTHPSDATSLRVSPIFLIFQKVRPLAVSSNSPSVILCSLTVFIRLINLTVFTLIDHIPSPPEGKSHKNKNQLLLLTCVPPASNTVPKSIGIKKSVLNNLSCMQIKSTGSGVVQVLESNRLKSWVSQNTRYATLDKSLVISLL